MARTRTQTLPTLPRIAPEDRLFALDVSSTCAGWAFVLGTGEVERFGRAKPPSKWCAEDRIDRIVAELEAELTGACAWTCAMEWQSHKVAARLPNAQGLAVLGQAQGSVREAMRRMGFPGGVWCISERLWTESTGKEARARIVRRRCPAYERWADHHGDDGLDVADAIGLGLWLTDKRTRI